MKSIFLIAICNLVALLSNQVNAQGIIFDKKSNWAEVEKLAKTNNKYIFLDAFATWCGPCKDLEELTFPCQRLGKLISDKFVPVRVQMDKTSADNAYVKSWYVDASAILSKFNITSYPTMLVLNTDLTPIGKITGFKDSTTLIKELNQILKTDTILTQRFEQYNMSKSDSSFAKALANDALHANRFEISKVVSDRYLNALSEREFFKKHNLQFAFSHALSSNDAAFKKLIKSPKKVDEILESRLKGSVQRLINRISYKEIVEPNLRGKMPDWDFIRKEMKKKNGSVDIEYLYGVRMSFAAETQNWYEFGKYYKLYYQTALTHSQYHINNMSWLVFENIKDTTVVNTAILAMEYDLKHYDGSFPNAWDTYANLLYKIGRVTDAIVAEEKAVKLDGENACKFNTKPNSSYLMALERMKAGK